MKHFRLKAGEAIKPFNCGNEKLNSFLFNKAEKFQNSLVSVTYLLEDTENTIAYYSVSNDLLKISPNESRAFKSLLKKTMPSSIVYDMLSWQSFPAVKLDMFAVDKNYQRKGIGEQMLMFIVKNFTVNNKTGCLFITADVLNTDQAVSFYSKNKFHFLSEKDIDKESRLMFRILKL